MQPRHVAAAVVMLAFALGGRQFWFRQRLSPGGAEIVPAGDSTRQAIEFPDTLRRGETLALLNLETYCLLVTERGWTPAHYESWLGDLLVRHLLK